MHENFPSLKDTRTLTVSNTGLTHLGKGSIVGRGWLRLTIITEYWVWFSVGASYRIHQFIIQQEMIYLKIKQTHKIVSFYRG